MKIMKGKNRTHVDVESSSLLPVSLNRCPGHGIFTEEYFIFISKLSMFSIFWQLEMHLSAAHVICFLQFPALVLWSSFVILKLLNKQSGCSCLGWCDAHLVSLQWVLGALEFFWQKMPHILRYVLIPVHHTKVSHSHNYPSTPISNFHFYPNLLTTW